MKLLQKFNRETIRRVGLALTPLSAFALSASTYSDPNAFDAPSVEQVVEKSGGLLTDEQALQRIEDARQRHDAGFNNYLVTREDPSEYYRDCFQMDYSADQVPSASRVYYRNIGPLLNQRGYIATAIREQAIRADIFMCLDAENMPADRMGGWKNNSDGIVTFNDQARYHSQMLSATVHEIFHSIQDDNNVSFYPTHMSLEDAQIWRLSFEAAAKTLDTLYIFESNLEAPGTIEVTASYRTLYKLIESEYEEARSDGVSHQRALERAGHLGWESLFTNQYWLDYYNTTVIKNFIINYQEGRLDEPENGQYTVEDARLTGQLNDEFNFLRNLETLPEQENRFGTNRDIRQIFQVLKIRRIEQVYGRNNHMYRGQLYIAVSERNPYLGVDLNEIDTTQGNANLIQQFKKLVPKNTRQQTRPSV